MPVFRRHYKKGEIAMKTKDYPTPWHRSSCCFPCITAEKFLLYNLEQVEDQLQNKEKLWTWERQVNHHVSSNCECFNFQLAFQVLVSMVEQ